MKGFVTGCDDGSVTVKLSGAFTISDLHAMTGMVEIAPAGQGEVAAPKANLDLIGEPDEVLGATASFLTANQWRAMALAAVLMGLVRAGLWAARWSG